MYGAKETLLIESIAYARPDGKPWDFIMIDERAQMW